MPGWGRFHPLRRARGWGCCPERRGLHIGGRSLIPCIVGLVPVKAGLIPWA